MTGKHHAPGRFVASAGETCARCGAPVVGQFCDACGFRVSARRPFAPLGGGHPEEASSPAPAQTPAAAPAAPAAPWETSPSPSGLASSGPPESLFPPVSKPEPPFSAWSRPEQTPSPSSPPRPANASDSPAAWPPEAPGVREAAETPEDAGVVGLLESLFSPAPADVAAAFAVGPA